MKYIHILIFLITHDLTFLKRCWETEFIKGSFSWRKILTRIVKNNDINYMFWWRLANEMCKHGSKAQHSASNKLHQAIKRQYNMDILLGAEIDIGLNVGHFMGIVIHRNVSIGKNFTILQNCTIGEKNKCINIKVGDNVIVGANSVILGGDITIGSNVTIGAMSFIDKNIPDNCTVYTEKTNIIKSI